MTTDQELEAMRLHYSQALAAQIKMTNAILERLYRADIWSRDQAHDWLDDAISSAEHAGAKTYFEFLRHLVVGEHPDLAPALYPAPQSK